MSTHRPDPDKPRTVTDTELNEALERGDLEKGLLNIDKVEHDEGQRAPGPVSDEERRPPREQDVSNGENGTPVEPPD